MTQVEKMSYFEVASHGLTIAYKNVDNLLKNSKNIFLFVMQPKNMMFKKCSNFHWCILRDFNYMYIKKVYELFDNPSYC